MNSTEIHDLITALFLLGVFALGAFVLGMQIRKRLISIDDHLRAIQFEVAQPKVFDTNVHTSGDIVERKPPRPPQPPRPKPFRKGG